MNFPVVINNRNRLTTTRNLVNDLIARNTETIWIIDNNSNYEPLLDWYSDMSNVVNVFRCDSNVGYLALFHIGLLDEIKTDWCFYTDSDIELNEKMPVNYQEMMLENALKFNKLKVGLALRTDDLPDHYPYKEEVIENESGWWKNCLAENIYEAHTDTTFSLIKKVDQFDSIRMAGDFTCRHKPWYLDFNNLNDEEKFYIENHDDSRLTFYTRKHLAMYNK